jgi:hypothetical protein
LGAHNFAGEEELPPTLSRPSQEPAQGQVGNGSTALHSTLFMGTQQTLAKTTLPFCCPSRKSNECHLSKLVALIGAKIQ